MARSRSACSPSTRHSSSSAGRRSTGVSSGRRARSGRCCTSRRRRPGCARPASAASSTIRCTRSSASGTSPSSRCITSPSAARSTIRASPRSRPTARESKGAKARWTCRRASGCRISAYQCRFPPMKTIAIEEHFSTPMLQGNLRPTAYRNFFLTSRSEQLGHDIVTQLGDLDEGRIAHMDAAGIDVQVLSFGSPGPQAFEAAVAIPMARDANERLYEAMKKHPTRFAVVAALPTAAPPAPADEPGRTVKKLGFKGAMIHGHQQGSFLDDKKYWAIWDRAVALDVPIYLHPRQPSAAAMKAYFDGYEDIAGAAWGFAVDTSIHFLRILFAGVFDAYPRLKIILGHLGEGLPFAMHRLNDISYRSAARRGLKKQPIEYRSEEHTSELQSPCNLVCRLLLEKKKKTTLRTSRLQCAVGTQTQPLGMSRR